MVIRPTAEQARIIQFSGSRLVVKARAGSGKTTTFFQIAQAYPRERMLYLAYSRAIRDAAAQRFPKRQVDCKTSHQLAFPKFGKLLRHKISHHGNIPLRELANALDTSNWAFVKDVLDVLTNFMCSADMKFYSDHFTRFNGKPNLTTKMVQYQAEVVDAAERVWVRMCDPDDPFPTVHDCYLKLYQLSMPDLSLQYKRILFDEAQDANPVTSQIVLSQSCKLTLVGDEHQQIFRYRGAVNALDHPLLNDVPRLYLTNSFRFGPNVAIVANALLELKGETVPVVGRGQADTVTLHVPMGTEHRCLVSRTVMGVLESALAAAARGESIFWVGGIENYKVQDLLDLHHLSRGELGNVKNKKLKADYKDYEECKEAAEQTKDHEMQRSVRILETYAAEDIPAMIDHLKSLTVEEEMEASITVTTAHRSKGLEWDTVQLTDDYPDIFDPDMEPEAREDEINLLYVGSSRAMRVLIINAIIEIILNQVAQRRRARAKIEMVTA